jgi:hypothetical protein
MVTLLGFSVAHTRVADWPGWMDAGCARKSVMRAGGGVRCWIAPEDAGLGGAASGGACATASEIDIKAVSVSRIMIPYFFSKNLL